MSGANVPEVGEPAILCDHRCILPDGHDGPHQHGYYLPSRPRRGCIVTTIDYGSTPYSKLKRSQLLTLAYALEDMRDRAIERYETAEAALERVRELHQPRTITVLGWGNDAPVEERNIQVCRVCDAPEYAAAEYPCQTIRALDGGGE